MTLKEITDTILVEFTAKQVVEYNDLIAKRRFTKGIPTDDADRNVCPTCGNEFGKKANFCEVCGQAVLFVESDAVPL